jgi:hypothetical protein
MLKDLKVRKNVPGHYIFQFSVLSLQRRPEKLGQIAGLLIGKRLVGAEGSTVRTESGPQ